LLSSSNQRATEILQKILSGNSSNRIKKRAMFVLSQSGDPKAFKAISDIAIGKNNDALQIYAIETLGISGEKSSSKVLKEIYQKSSSKKVKGKVLDSFMMAGDSTTLISLAKSESDKELKGKTISLIGVMGESTVLVSMYKDKSFEGFKGKILEGIAIGDGAEQLQNIVETETEQKYLVKAIEKMGIINARKAGPILVDLYSKRTEVEVKHAVIKALFIQSNGKAMLEIVKQEKDPALKRQALKYLSMMDSDEVLDYFSKVLEQGA
ncbi:MAG: HEAT repeat domain-containing protein, partial [Kangiellaceae bacterium]|nr:HEAT repeat domain-containing protein [Kangiellaceae bacterium]